MSLHGTCVFRVLRCTRSDIYNRLKLLHRFSTSTCYGTAKKEDINLDDNPSSKSVQGPVEEVADIKISQDVAFTESLQPVRRPTNLDKICLLWAGKYKTRDDIPEFVKMNLIASAQNYMRVVVMIWLIVTFTVGFYTIGRFGQRKLNLLYDDVATKQNQIWVRKNKIADDEYALKKQKEREEKERHSS